MSFGNTFENDLMKLIFNGTPIAGIADNAASAPLADLYVSLHTADPGEGGTQATSEATYTGYSRVQVARDNTGWTVVNNTITNAALVQFPEATGGSDVVTHFVIGTASSGTGKLLARGELAAPRSVSAGIQPQFAAGTLTGSLD